MGRSAVEHMVGEILQRNLRNLHSQIFQHSALLDYTSLSKSLAWYCSIFSLPDLSLHFISYKKKYVEKLSFITFCNAGDGQGHNTHSQGYHNTQS